MRAGACSAESSYVAQRLLTCWQTTGEFSTGGPMNPTLKAANISFHKKGDASNPNKEQPVSKPDEQQSTEAAVSSTGGTPSAAWSEALTCEARNSLQVVLSGTEILLEDHAGNLQSHQKALLAKIMDNAYHLCHLISLLGPEEFKLEQMSLDEIKRIRHVANKN
jgi:hypothetical protein